MKSITTSELLSLNGGAAGNSNCVELLQAEAGKHIGDELYDWDDWAIRYEECVFGHQ